MRVLHFAIFVSFRLEDSARLTFVGEKKGPVVGLVFEWFRVNDEEFKGWGPGGRWVVDFSPFCRAHSTGPVFTFEIAELSVLDCSDLGTGHLEVPDGSSLFHLMRVR